MKTLAKAFYTDPVLALGVLQAIATGLAGSDVIAPWVGVCIVGVLTVFQRSLVKPDPPPSAPLSPEKGEAEVSLLLIVVGIVLALLVHYALGIACILVGLVLLVLPRLTPRR